MPACSLNAPRAPRDGHNDGFALLITITLLSFLVLLLVTLASLTRVETQVASNSQQLQQARQNALFALNVALGQLQKQAGPDQRVTATADLAATTAGNRAADGATPSNDQDVNGQPKGLTSVQAGTRFWTGVWGDADAPADIFTKTPDPALLGWLVSGNENQAISVDAATGRITASSGVSAPFQPGLAVTPALSVSSKATDALEIGHQAAVLLVGPNTAGTAGRYLDAPGNAVAEAPEDRYVVAPLVDIKASPGAVPGLAATSQPVIGRYAYWVGDEGVKIKYTDRDPYASQSNLYTSPAARYRVAVAQRNGIEAMDGLGGYPANNAVLDKLLAPQQLGMADGAVTSAVARSHFHDVTVASAGVVADSLNGGLRQDLTWLLTDNGFASAGLTGKSILPSAYTPVQSTNLDGTSKTVTYCPTWDWLKSFRDLPYASGNQLAYNLTGSNASISVQAASATQMGVAPVVTQVRYQFFAKLAGSGSGGPVTIRTHFLIVLGNPYPVTLKSAGIWVNLSADDYYYDGWNGSKETAVHGIALMKSQNLYPQRTDAPDNSLPNTFGCYLSGADESSGKAQEPVDYMPYDGQTDYAKLPLFPPATHNAAKTGITQSDKTLFGSIRFRINAIDIPPGEQRVYSIDGSNTASLVDYGNTGALTTIALKEDAAPYIGYVDMPVAGWGGIVADNSQPQVNLYWMRMEGNGNFAVTLKDDNGDVIKSIHHIDIDGNQNWSRVQGWPKAVNPDIYYSIGGARIYPVWPADSGWGPNNRLQLFADYNLRAADTVMPRNSTPNAGFYSAPPYTSTIISTLDSSTSTINANMVSPLWGYDYLTGNISEVTLFGVPREDPANDGGTLVSLGFLQHANLTADDQNLNVGHQPGAAFGNSRFSPFVNLNESVSAQPDYYDAATMRANPADLPSGPAGTTRFFDMSYLLNASLWDGYYFSTIPQATASAFVPGTTLLADSRLVFAAPHLPALADLGVNGGIAKDYGAGAARDMPGQYAGARYQMIDGAFNVNSTSIQAWKALLTSLRGTTLNNPDGTVWTAASLNAPFPHTLDPWGNKSSLPTSGGQAAEDYAGFRDLTDVQIQSLAEEMVRQVRTRGPFLSLAQFVNRSLSASDPGATSGAIQASIDANTGSINLPGDSTVTDGTQGTVANGGNYYPTQPATTVVRNRKAGIPGWLTQADVLQALGPVLSARSDTFVIRVYGEVSNPLDPTAKPVARAWGEATVQRFPDYVNPADLPSVRPAALTSADNRDFGRRFRVVSFRWLTPNDI